MNISFLISNLSGGGAERVCVILANALSKLKWNVDVIVLTDTQSQNKQLLNDSINVISLNSCRARYAPLKLSKNLYTSAPDIVVTMNNEVLVAEYFANLLIPRSYILIHRCVTTLSSTVFQTNYRRFAHLRYFFLKNILRSVDCIVSQCSSMKLDTNNELNICSSRSLTIYNPVSFNPIILNKVQTHDTPYILLVGRLDFNKSFHLAIEALAALPKEHSDVQLWIAGVGPCEHELFDLAKNYEISHRVKLLGFRNDLNHLYQNAVLVSLTSMFEGFPNVLLESIVNGTPVVSLDCPNGPNEIVIDGVNGFLVKDRNVNALATAYAKALKWVWDSNQIRQTANRFAEECIVKKWDALFRNLLDLHVSKHA